jgi:hypothetical protein
MTARVRVGQVLARFSESLTRRILLFRIQMSLGRVERSIGDE